MSEASATLESILLEAFKSRVFQAGEHGPAPIPYVWRRGSSRLVLIVGENAAGKSLMRRVVCHCAQRAGCEPINVSMAGRTRAGIQRLFVYGTEDDESTGRNSARTVTAGIRTCQGREWPHIIFWDEPDLGLSESWAAGMGMTLRGFVSTMAPSTVAAFVVTHSRPLAGQLAQCGPHYVGLGEGCPGTLSAWLRRRPRPLPIEELERRSGELRHRVQLALNAPAHETSPKPQSEETGG